MPVPSSKGERTRTEIIAAAHGLFVEQGYHGTSMRQLARRAGIALGGIYNHFPSKQDLFAGVFLEHHPYLDIIPALDAARGDSVEDLVRDAAARLLEALAARPDFLNLMFIEIVEFNNAHSPQLFKLIYPRLSGFARRLEGMQPGSPSLPVPIQLRAFLGLFFSFALFENIMGEEIPGELTIGAFDDFVEIYLHGIKGR